jgi:hypothetical protein
VWCGLRFRNKRRRLTNGLIFNGGHHPGGDIKLQHLCGIATQRIADEMVTLPGFCISEERLSSLSSSLSSVSPSIKAESFSFCMPDTLFQYSAIVNA